MCLCPLARSRKSLMVKISCNYKFRDSCCQTHLVPGHLVRDYSSHILFGNLVPLFVPSLNLSMLFLYMFKYNFDHIHVDIFYHFWGRVGNLGTDGLTDP